MNRFAFQIFGIDIAWYGIIITAAIAIATLITMRIATRRGYTNDNILDLALWVIPFAIVGARLYYVIFQWRHYIDDPIRILYTREGGMAIHGGVFGGLLGGYLCCRLKKLNFADLADMVAVSLILAQSIGRWGNFTNGEAHGGPTDLPWAIEVGGEMVHPTFLYESLWNLLCFVILAVTFKRRTHYGVHFNFYLILYSVGRFFIEGFRTDSLLFFGFRQAQIISVVLIVFAVGCIALIRRNPAMRVRDGSSGNL